MGSPACARPLDARQGAQGMGANLGVGVEAKEAHARWSSADRVSFLKASGLVHSEGEEAVLRFLADAIILAPLPAPWDLHTDEEGEYFFFNRRTGEASRKHPLEASLQELAGVCRECLDLAPGSRDERLAALGSRWEADAKGAYLQWFEVEDGAGGRYYCHRGTREAMWEHPAEVLLPEHYMRLRALERLRDGDYLARIRSRPPEPLVPTRCPRRRKQPQAFFIGDPDPSAAPPHVSIEVLPERCGRSVCRRDSDLLSVRSSDASTEAYFIGDSEDEEEEAGDPWPDLDLEADWFGAP